MVGEVIHGAHSIFKEPSRFSFAHGGKDGHLFPVTTNVYDERREQLQNAVNKAKLGNTEKAETIKKLHEISVRVEEDFKANNSKENFERLLQKERDEPWKYGGKTGFGDAQASTTRKYKTTVTSILIERINS